MAMSILLSVNPERANSVYDMLRKVGFSRNRAKILALLEQKTDIDLADVTGLLGISNSRASEGLKFLLREGYIQRMGAEIILRPGIVESHNTLDNAVIVFPGSLRE